MTTPTPRARVAICILTLWRPQRLRAALTSLAELDDSGADVHIVVVDNDPDGSAHEVVDDSRADVPHPIHYAVESRRGIPFGRNRAVNEARALGATHVAFIDDDETPTRPWLRELLRVQRATGADVIMGPVLPRFEVTPPRWIVTGRLFERRRRLTGDRMHYATTGNVLVTMASFADEVAPFAEWTALSGGEDTHFFLRAVLAGRTIRWCDEAEVIEMVPRSRMRARWLIRRRYRVGNTLSLCLVDLEDSPARRARRAAGATARMTGGLLRTVFGIVRGRAGMLEGLEQVAFGAGQLTGLIGLRYDEYRVIHGA